MTNDSSQSRSLLRRSSPFFQDRFAHLGAIERKRIPPTPADALRLHRLERPEPWERELADEIWRTQPPFNWYPDYAAFHRRLAEFWGVSPDRLVMGAGIEDLIRTLFILCVGDRGSGFGIREEDPENRKPRTENRDQVAFTWPTCAMFDVYARVFGAEAVHLSVRPDEPHEAFHAVAERIEACDRLKLVILSNPGQPVETCFNAEEIIALAHRCRRLGAVLAIDEAYYGFGAPTAARVALSFDNVVVLRTFSKAFGGAALRVGFAVGLPTVIGAMDAIRLSGELAGPSMHAASVLMDRWESHVEPGIRAVCEGRDRLRKRMIEDGFKASGSLANHLLIELEDAAIAADVGRKLWDAGTRVKFGFPAPVDRHLLVTCGSPSVMARFYDLFREQMSDDRGRIAGSRAALSSVL